MLNKGFDAKSDLGARLRAIRKANKWTLDEAHQRCKVGRSTLSKIENGSMSPTFELLQKIVQGMNIDMVDLFDGSNGGVINGRRSITRKGAGALHHTKTYNHELIATDLSQKRFLPFKSTINTFSLEDFDGWVRHEGEEFLIVVSGKVEVHTEHYSPVELLEGDSIYFDSKMGHCIISLGDSPAEVLWVCSNLDIAEYPTR